MEKTVAIIQARIGSTRLPGKVNLKFGELTTIERQVLTLRMKCRSIDEIVLAIPDTEQDRKELLERYDGMCKIWMQQGDQNDVMGRFLAAGKEFGAEDIVRICADSPFIQSWAIDYAVAKHKQFDMDFTFTYGMPAGMNAEVISYSALEKAYPKTDYEEREHVTLCFEHRPWGLKIQPLDLSNMSLDTLGDYNFLREVARYGS